MNDVVAKSLTFFRLPVARCPCHATFTFPNLSTLHCVSHCSASLHRELTWFTVTSLCER